jgi:hypothetical protein
MRGAPSLVPVVQFSMTVIDVFGVRRFCGVRVRKFAVPIGDQLLLHSILETGFAFRLSR